MLLPLIAPIFGREVIRETAYLKAASILTSICNRNYVVPSLNETLIEIQKGVAKEGITVLFLDANFPFFNGFPLIPHLSHNDGKKIYLAFVYEYADKGYSDEQKSRSGYGVFEVPSKGEVNQVKNCIRLGYWQYDLTKWLTFGKVNGDLNFSNEGTKKLVTSLVKNSRVEKIFLEPHLVNRLKLESWKIRYHGCRAVRHDDHIHFQVY